MISMKYLLDTHILLWALADKKRVAPILDILEDPRNEIYYSAASIWEVSIKSSKGHLDALPEDVVKYARKQMYQEVHITSEHTLLLQELTYPDDLPIHKDPFDRILIAQAMALGAKLITMDDKICRYNEPCIFRFPG